MEVKIGVFLCDCGRSLKNIDFPKISGDLEKLEDVAFVDISHNLCLEEGEKAMASRILAENINRVVIAACSLELCEHIFTGLLERLRLNPNLLSLANIREQCSWAHEGDVTGKALELIRMAINKARLLQPVERTMVPVNKEVLVVGGGFSGMKSALELSQLGIRTTMMERELAFGGKLKELEGFYGLETSPKEMLSSMTKAIEGDENIEVLTSAEVARVQGEVGDFAVRIRRGGKEISRSFGAIIFATGYKTEIVAQDFELKPGVNIISQLELVEMLRAPEKLERRPETIGFVLDVSDENSRLPTLSTLNNALAVKEELGSEVYVFCRNLKVDSEGTEKLYREARNRGVMFLKFDESPQIYGEDGRVKVKAKDVLLGGEVTLLCDFLVAEEKTLPPEGTKALSSMLNIGTDFQGFYQDENVHLFPVESARKGMFFVGGCRGNLAISRALTDIASAVMSIHELLSLGEAMVEVEKVKADSQKCRACLTCIRVCPHEAIRLVRVDTEKWTAKIYDLACDGCGVCAAICPANAIKFEGYSDEQILAEVEAIGG
jgi:heterodisulfide reductase subunit A